MENVSPSQMCLLDDTIFCHPQFNGAVAERILAGECLLQGFFNVESMRKYECECVCREKLLKLYDAVERGRHKGSTTRVQCLVHQ
jgi:hypothetical protein